MKRHRNYRNCPFCGEKVSFFKKMFFMNTIYPYTCPNCGNKMKVKRIGMIWCLLICVIVIITVKIDEYNKWIGWVVFVIFVIVSNIYLYFAELVREKSYEDGK